MSKLKTLKQLKKTIETKELISGNYATRFDSEGCRHCAIGYILVNSGLPLEKIKSLDKHEISPYKDYAIEYIMNEKDVEDDFVNHTLTSVGFDLENENDRGKLIELQQINDRTKSDQRKAVLTAFINQWIEEIEQEQEEQQNENDNQ